MQGYQKNATIPSEMPPIRRHQTVKKDRVSKIGTWPFNISCGDCIYPDIDVIRLGI